MIHLALVAALAVDPAPARHDIDAIDATKHAAITEEQFEFCTDPAKPLGPRQKMTCAMAREVEGCKALVEACDAEQPPSTDWLAKLVLFLAPVAHVFLYLMIAIIVIAVAIPVVGALLQLKRRRKKAGTQEAGPNVAQVIAPVSAPPPEEVDPDEALREAEALLASGDYKRALAFALTAALGALGRRGAIRIARHRTNGEYVRSCAEETARPPLREIVRTVDAVEFGGAEATSDKAKRVTALARAVVSVVAVLVLFGCSPPKHGTDPAGDELPLAVLARNGYDIKPLGSSLSTLPVPENEQDGTPVVVIDMERVPLESETQAHLMRWVEAGGVLVLFGHVEAWPQELNAKLEFPNTRDLDVDARDPNEGLLDPESDETPEIAGKPITFGARVGRRDGFSWKGTAQAEHETIAKLGPKTYASKRHFGRGFILGIANDDLWTNVGVMPPRNAAALVTIIRSASHDLRRRLPIIDGKIAFGELRVARPEDGIPPPSNPFAALIAAGLGKGAWHALAAAILLFLCYGIRQARPRSAPGAPRRAFVEHVEATGAFYARTPARSHALASYGRFLELRLRELAPRGADPSAFLAARTGADPERVTRLYARALDAKTDELPKGDELEVIGELRTLLAKAIGANTSR